MLTEQQGLFVKTETVDCAPCAVSQTTAVSDDESPVEAVRANVPTKVKKQSRKQRKQGK